MKYQMVLLPLVFAVSGCAVEQDRTGYPDAWYYERLTPYYTNDLALTPRVHLRAVRELVGVPITFDYGSTGHADVFRNDIELFFAAPVTSEEERINLIRSAVRVTCPQTDMEEIQDRVAYFNDTYIVLRNTPCRGHAS
jgi:hypothetical protein